MSFRRFALFGGLFAVVVLVALALLLLYVFFGVAGGETGSGKP